MSQRSISTLLLALLAVLAWISPALADDPRVPADVSLATIDLAALPAAPEGFTSRDEGAVHWDFPIAAEAIVDQLASTLRAEWPRIEDELGADVDDSLVIRVARSPDEMAALAPSNAPPPAYAVGVAYPASGLVLLTLSAPETWERPDLINVIVHELSHVALHRAVGGNAVPRWLTEGVAIHQAHERSFDRVQTLWDATVRGTLIPLDDLSRSFPSRPHRVSIAYAESADFVEYMFRRGDGAARFPELISRMSRGQPFETAVSQTWSAGIGQLEHDWREGLSERYGVLPLLLGTGAIWSMISLLVVLAWFRRRQESRATLRRWEAEEAEHAREAARERAIAELRAHTSSEARARLESSARELAAATDTAAIDTAATEDMADEPDDDDDAPAALSIPKRDGEPRLPTITWEGRNHTLH